MGCKAPHSSYGAAKGDNKSRHKAGRKYMPNILEYLAVDKWMVKQPNELTAFSKCEISACGYWFPGKPGTLHSLGFSCLWRSLRASPENICLLQCCFNHGLFLHSESKSARHRLQRDAPAFIEKPFLFCLQYCLPGNILKTTKQDTEVASIHPSIQQGENFYFWYRKLWTYWKDRIVLDHVSPPCQAQRSLCALRYIQKKQKPWEQLKQAGELGKHLKGPGRLRNGSGMPRWLCWWGVHKTVTLSWLVCRMAAGGQL